MMIFTVFLILLVWCLSIVLYTNEQVVFLYTYTIYLYIFWCVCHLVVRENSHQTSLDVFTVIIALYGVLSHFTGLSFCFRCAQNVTLISSLSCNLKSGNVVDCISYSLYIASIQCYFIHVLSWWIADDWMTRARQRSLALQFILSDRFHCWLRHRAIIV
jgi:hypothetical protein